MQKIFIILLTLSFSLFGYTSIKEIKYESGISIYGQIGFVHLSLEENHDTHTYKMTAKTTSVGVVKYLSNNRIDTFISEGNVQNGVYLPLKFTRSTTKNKYKKTRTYLFDYENKNIHKTQIISRIETISTFHPISVSFSETEELVTEKEEKDIDFERNDFLSLYLNLIKGNLSHGKVPYVDMKEKDSLIFVKKNLFEVHKNNGEDKYLIVMIPDEESVFFKQVTSVGISFYGDAYIKKIHESTQNLD